MEVEISDLRGDIRKLALDIALIKEILIEDGELTEWALTELEESREISSSECVSQGDVRKMILAK